MIKQKQFAKRYLKEVKNRGANLSRKRKKELKRAIINIFKSIPKNEYDSFNGVSLSEY